MGSPKKSKGFKPDKTMRWQGKGPDRRLAKPKVKKLSGPIDLPKFMKRLEDNTDPAKLSKALSMLKAERFKLYVQVESDSRRSGSAPDRPWRPGF